MEDVERCGLIVNAADSSETGRKTESSPLVNFKDLFGPNRGSYELLNSIRETGTPEEPWVSIRTHKTPIPRRVCRNVISQLNEVLVEYHLDFSKILPFLKRKQLLDTESQDYLEKNRPQNRKVNFLVEKLLENPNDDVLTPFVQCLLELEDQDDECKTAFKDIIEEIDVHWRKEMKKFEENTIPKKLHYFCKKYSCITLPIIMIVNLIIVLLVLLPLFSSVPPFFQKQGPQTVTNIKKTTVVMTLDHLINKQFVSSVTMRWKNKASLCAGNVTVLDKIHCLDTHFLLRVDHFKDTNAFFALPGSTINVTIPDGDEAKDLTVTLKKSMKEYINFLYEEHLRSTELCYAKENCFRTNEYLNRTLSFNISESDFYYVFLIDSDGVFVTPERVHIDFEFDIISINQTAVMEYAHNHSIKPVYISPDNQTFETVNVSKWFDFNDRTCIVFSFRCEQGSYPSFVIENAKPKGGIIFLISLSFLFLLIFFCVCLFLGCHRVKK